MSLITEWNSVEHTMPPTPGIYAILVVDDDKKVSSWFAEYKPNSTNPWEIVKDRHGMDFEEYYEPFSFSVTHWA